MNARVLRTVGLSLLGALAVGVIGCAVMQRHEPWRVGGLARQEVTAEMRHAPGPAAAEGSHRQGAPLGRAMQDEELWIIERAAGGAAREAPAEDEAPGGGALLARLPERTEVVPVPLKHTDVKASIAGYIASVDVVQQYHNPFDTKIEAIYVFPLPHNAAVSEFVMTVGERKIRGIIREREEAQQIYQQARSQGYIASLLTQERPNIFTQKVANIEPAKQIDINIRYFHTLSYSDGWYEWVFPMVVGPRFNPPGFADGVGAVRRDARGVSGQKTEVQYLRPHERSGHDIALAVELDAGVRLEKIECRSHSASMETEGSRATVVLAEDDRIPNRDFILRYQVAGEMSKSAVLAHRDQRGGYFSLMLFPPQDLSDLPRKPLEMVFTLDVSGSMSGRPIQQAKRAIGYALSNMDSRDTFQVILFASNARQLFSTPMPATRRNIDSALRFIEGSDAGGGTMMIDGIRQSLNFPHDQERLRFVVFLTDGFIGNEAGILREIHASLGPSRIFSFGVGSSTNRYLLDHMARMGQGAAAYLALNDDPEAVMRPFLQRISHPAMTDIEIDWGGLGVTDVYPQRMPDLFVGRPVILTGRFNGDRPATVRLRGRVGAERVEMAVPVQVAEAAAAQRALPAVWARAKLADLGDRAAWDVSTELPQEIRHVALQYGLISAYTAFVAVDSMTRTGGEYGVSVNVPVPVPDGVRYETTVQETSAGGEK